MTSKFAKFSLAINLIEVPRDVPCFVLLCSEERNWFTFLQNKMQDEMKFHVVPITEDDDMLSPYGICKARRCLRTKLDSVFFAGPCTGGSPWNRINRWVSEATTQLIEAKKQIFWAMWEVFTSVLCELINMGSPALLELPRGCDYWKDRRMTDLVEGTVSHEHKFDGCMYGLKSQFQETPKPIKKPWKIVTWGVSFPKLRRKCDRRHDHAECAGRETRITQVYTKWIAKIIMKGINEHVIKNSPFGNVKVRKHWKIIAPDDDWLSEMSRDSENVRSHPIKLVTTNACAIRGPDAIDLLFERSLLHWYFSRSTSPLTRSSWSSAFLRHLLPGFNDNLLFRDQRSVQLLELIGALSHCYLSIQTEPLKITMTENVDLKSIGQFSNKRITIAQRILKETHEKVITARPPPPFRDTRNTGPRLLSSEDTVNQWIRFGMPPVIVYSAYFANTRYTNEATGEALELAYKILQKSLDSEKECLGWEFVSRGSRFVKVFTSRCPYENNMVGLLMDEDIHSRLDELWVVLTKGHFPEPFDDTHSAAFAEAKIRDMKQLYRGTPSFNTEPGATSWLAVTRTAEYFKVMDELAKVNPRSPSDNESYFATMRQMVETHIKLLGFSLRYHNQSNPHDLIILKDVMRDVVDFETERPKGRSAAQNHFLCLLTLGSTIERHKNCARGDGNYAKVAAWTEIQRRSSTHSTSRWEFWLDWVTTLPSQTKVQDILKRKDAMPATVNSKTSSRQWLRRKQELVAACTTSTDGTNLFWSMMEGCRMNLMHGTMKNHHGHKMTRLEDQARLEGQHLKVAHKPNPRQRRAAVFSLRECQDHPQAAELPRPPSPHFEPDLDLHHQVSKRRRKRKTRTKRQMLIGWRGRNPQTWRRTFTPPKTMPIKNSGSNSWDRAKNSSSPLSRVLTPLMSMDRIWYGNSTWDAWPSMQHFPSTSWLKDNWMPRCSMRTTMNGWSFTTISLRLPNSSDAEHIQWRKS